MTVRLVGALLLIAGSISAGFSMVSAYKREVRMLQELDHLITDISCSLQYRLTPLPQLLRAEMNTVSGSLRSFLLCFIKELESQIAPDVACCLKAAFAQHTDMPHTVCSVLLDLGNSFGRFDLQGQLKCLEATQTICERELSRLESKQAGYTKCCQAYSLCVGVIIALLFL